MEENNTILFLQTIIEEIKNKTITPRQNQILTEFNLQYHFEESVNDDTFTDRDMINFLALGWYMYNNLNKIDI